MTDENDRGAAQPPNRPDPQPERSTGLEPGGGVPPGETPPGESSLSGAGPEETYNPTKGWARGPLIVVALIVLVFVGYFVARLFVT
ncbi:DUF6480 family protein [Streptomyces sp. TRM70308]|uniref:DUF6480 family protein n=1 Tax=Streptomyces sp. TRM70308 TaxID=3131932 RepID=UPI003D058CFD